MFSLRTRAVSSAKAPASRLMEPFALSVLKIASHVMKMESALSAMLILS